MPKEPIFFTNLDDLKDGLTTDKAFEVLRESAEEEPQWFMEDYEGQLSVDVYQTDTEIVVKSTISGVLPEDLQVFLHDDLLTIRGKRTQDFEAANANYLYKECFWGGFSRSIILPVEVNPDAIKATFSNGVLTVRLPIIERTKRVHIKVDGQ